MIQIDADDSARSQQIILCPNLSPDWRINSYLLSLLATLVMGVAIGFALQGAWLILPFAGLEVLALFGLVLLVTRRCQRMEVIRLEEQDIVVEQGRHAPEHVWRSQRFFTRLQVVRSAHPWYPPRIVLRGRASEIEIGAFLNDSEKQQLVRQLGAVLNGS